MNMNAQYYIAGDAPKIGFNRIGSSDNFHQDEHATWVNDGNAIEDRCRVDPVDYRQTGRLERLCHVWEYQTDRFGVPMFIDSYAGIETGRFHGYSVYIMPDCDKNVSEVANAGQMIAAAANVHMLDFEGFWHLEKVPIQAQECVLNIAPAHTANVAAVNKIDEAWLLTLISRYWKSASLRACSSPFEPVLVCLGEFSENKQEDIEKTIETAQNFYANCIAPKLPPQVQNITSFTAGVDCRDNGARLHSALLFCISENLSADEALQLNHQKDLQHYRLCPAEMNFIRDVAAGETPTFVTELMNKYKALHKDAITDVHHIPFMADYQVWYTLYCVEHLLKEGNTFLSLANLDVEETEESKIRIRPARACFNLMEMLRATMSRHVKQAEMEELLKDYELQLFQVMLSDMQQPEARTFLAHSSDMCMLHERILTCPYEDMAQVMIQLITLDQKKSKNPNFIRFYPGTRLTESMDERNAAEMKSLLDTVIAPLIEKERGNDKPTNDFIVMLGKDEFVRWANHYEKTRKVFHDFFSNLIQDAQMHFLLYGITYNYLSYAELASNTLHIFTEQYSTSGTMPELKSRVCAVLNDAVYFENMPDVDVAKAFTDFCITCFNHYDTDMESLKEFFTAPKAFPIPRGREDRCSNNNLARYSTAAAMTAIFEAAENQAEPMTSEQAAALLNTLKNGMRGSTDHDSVMQAYMHMLATVRDRMLKAGNSPIEWLAKMLEVVSFSLDTTDSLVAIFEACAASVGNGADDKWQVSPESAEAAFSILGHADNEYKYAKNDKVQEAYEKLLKTQQDYMLSKNRSPVEWLKKMMDIAPFGLDMTDSLVALFVTATETIGKVSEDQWLMTEADAKEAFEKLGGENAKFAKNEKVKSAYGKLLSAKRDQLLKNKKSPIDWLKNMLEVAPYAKGELDTTDSLVTIFEAAAKAVNEKTEDAWQLSDGEAKTAFEALGGENGKYAENDKVVGAYVNLLNIKRDALLCQGESPVDELQNLRDAAPFTTDMSDSVIVILKHYTEHAHDENAATPTATEIGRTFEVLYNREQTASKNEQVKNALLEMVSTYRDKMLDKDESPANWLNEIWEKADAYGLAFDTSDSMVAIFKYASNGIRMDSSAIIEVFMLLAKHAKAMTEKVLPCFTEMASVHLKKGLEEDDTSVIDWICIMARLGAEAFPKRFNTSGWLATIFQTSGEHKHPWMRALDAKTCFDAMADCATELKGSVRNAYSKMLDRRIQKEENTNRKLAEEDLFLWVAGMISEEATPYAQDSNWLTEQHEKMIKLLTADDYQNLEKLQIIAGWFNKNTMNRSSQTVLQSFCNDALKADIDEPALLFRDVFEVIDSRFEQLRNFYGKKMVAEFKAGLTELSISGYSQYIKDYGAQTDKVGTNLNKLYEDTKDAVDAFMMKVFRNIPDVNKLIEIGNGIPESHFKREWQNKLNAKLRHEQVSLFNDCRSIGDIQRLKSVLEQNGGLTDSLEAGYELMEKYDALLENLTKCEEDEALARTGKIICDEIFMRLDRAEPIGKVLCECLRSQKHAALDNLKAMSFRHTVAAWLMLAALTDHTDKEAGKRIQWSAVLNAVASSDALSKATKKPYEEENLIVLQRLLALIDVVCYVNRNVPMGDWSAALIQAVRTNSSWKQYQLALSRKAKQGAAYGLKFTTDGMLDFNEVNMDSSTNVDEK